MLLLFFFRNRILLRNEPPSVSVNACLSLSVKSCCSELDVVKASKVYNYY